MKKNLFKQWCEDDRGTTAVEYGLIVSGIVFAIIAAVFLFGDSMVTAFDILVGYIQTVVSDVGE